MIKKFNEFIEEGFLSKTISRSKFGKVRLEDKITSKEQLRDVIEERLKLNENADFSDLDVSEITDMSYLFDRLSPKNINISNWDVSNVKNMKCMFNHCFKFNADLSKWDVSNVENMWNMFSTCEQFNSDLSKWNVSKVKDMCNMFHFCTKLNCDLSNWDVSNVKRFGDMFWGCESLNTDLSKWNVSKAKVNSKRVRFKFNNMFFNCKNLQIPTWYKIIEEGFLSKTINRSKSDNFRIEDDTVVNRFLRYTKTIEWVDMGNSLVLFAKQDFDEPLSINNILDIIHELPNDIETLNSSISTYLHKLDMNKKDDVFILSHDGNEIFLKSMQYVTDDLKFRKITNTNTKACIGIIEPRYANWSASDKKSYIAAYYHTESVDDDIFNIKLIKRK